MLALCSHFSSLKGPLVTMFAGSVHLSPNFSTVFLLNGEERGGAQICWMNHGCGRRQLDLEGLVVERLHAHLVLQRVAVVLLGVAAVVLLRPDDAVELVRVVGAELRRDGALPRVLEIVRGDRVAVRPLESVAEHVRDGLAVLARLEALGGAPTGLRSSPSLTSGSMMFSRMLEEVVSVARPGSSDGGSVPQLTVIT